MMQASSDGQTGVAVRLSLADANQAARNIVPRSSLSRTSIDVVSLKMGYYWSQVWTGHYPPTTGCLVRSFFWAFVTYERLTKCTGRVFFGSSFDTIRSAPVSDNDGQS